MSQQIDNQIVKMQFDNASFEKNVQTSMSTLEKLKQALKFDKVDMTPLQQAFADAENTATKAGFHIRDVWLKVGSIIEDQVAEKIVNAGKKIFNALTMEGITDGFNEYELKMGSIQTIMAGTGESLAKVNKYLDELNSYSDQTIYSFADMTNNIGKFTNAGVKLDDAVNAIKGIANEAAVSGANANEASRAMYNFSQALSAGYVKLIDWKSIENANMATKEFKDTLLEMATSCGTVEKTADGMYEVLTTNNKGQMMDDVVSGTKNFNDSLQYQWMTTEVLTKTLKVYATDIRSLTDAEREAYEAELKSMGLNDEQIKRFEELGQKATDAASEIKTFSMLMDTLKEAIGSGWAMTWQLLIGDFEQAKKLWTDVGNTVSSVIDGMSDARNNFLKQGLRTGWEKTIAGGGLKDVIPDAEKFRQVLVDLAHEQGILNKEQYDGIYNTQTLLDSLHDKKWMTGDLLKEAVSDYKEVIKSMTDEELADMGFTQADIDQLEAFDTRLKLSADLADEFADSMNKLGGRENIIQGLSNVFHSLLDVLQPIGTAFDEVFGIMDPNKLYDLTERFRLFTEQLLVSEDAANTIHTGFKLAFGGIKAIIDGVLTTFKGLSKLVLPVFNLFDAIFGLVGKIVSALTGSKGALDAADKFTKIGDKISDKYLWAMQKLADFINKVADAIRGIPEATIFTKIHNGVDKAVTALKEFWDEFTNLPIVQQMVEDFWNTVEKIESTVTPIFDSIKQSIDGMVTTVESKMNLQTLNSVLTVVYNKLKNFMTLIKDFAGRINNFFGDLRSGKSVIESFKDSFGDIIEKIKELRQNAEDFFTSLFEKGDELGGKFNLEAIAQAIHDFVANITPEQITMLAIAGTFTLIALNMLRLSEAIKNAIDAFTGIGLALKNVINSYVKKQKSVILQIAESIVIVAAALWMLSTIPQAKMERALGAFITLTVCLGALVGALTAAGVIINKLGGEKSMIELAAGLAFVAGSFFIVAGTLKLLEYVDLKGVVKKVIAVGVILAGLIGLSVLMGKLDKFSKGALTLVAVAGALLIASTALAQIGSIPGDKLDKSLDAMLKMMLGLAAVTFAAGKVGIFSAVGLLAVVLMLDKLLPAIERIVNYDYGSMESGIEKNKAVLLKLGGLVLIMTAIGAIAGNRIKGAAVAMLSISATFAILLGISKLAGMMKPQELAKGEAFLWSMAGIIALLELCSKRADIGMWGGKNGGEGSKMFTRIAVAMGMMLGIAKLASMMSAKDLAKGGVALLGLVGIIGAIALVAKVTKDADTKGLISSVAKMLFAISVVLGMVAILSIVPLEGMIPAIATVLGIMAAIAGLALAMGKLTQVYDKDTQKSVSGVWAFLGTVIAIVALAGMILALSKEPMGNVATAAVSIIGMILAVSVLAKALSTIKGDKLNIGQAQAFIGTVFLVAIIAGVLALLTNYISKQKINPDTMVKAAASIALVIAAITPALFVLSRFNGTHVDYWGMAEAVGLAVVALASVATAIGLLSKFGNSAAILDSAIAIAVGLVAITVPIAVLGAVGTLCQNVKLGQMATLVGAAIVVLAGVAGAIWALSNYGNPDTMVKSAQALAIALIAISVPIAVLGAVGRLCTSIGMGGIAGMAVSVVGAIVALGAIAGILVWFSNNINLSSLETLNAAIPILITAMAGVSLMALAIAGAGLLSGGNFAAVLAGGLAMVEAIAIFAIIIAAIAGLGAALEKINGLESALTTGLDFLVVIAGKLGEAAGALIGGFGVGLTSQLDPIADNLNSFSEKMITFSENMSKINKEAVEGCKNLAAAMLYICASEFIDGITRWIGFGTVGTPDFRSLGTAMAGFCDAVKGVSSDAITKASACSVIAKRLAEISSSLDAKGGLAGMIFGDKQNLEDFADGVKKFGMAIFDFCNAVKGLPQSAIDDAVRAKDAAVPMVELSKQLYGEGGIIQKIAGEKNIGTFGENLTAFVGSLATFIGSLAEIEAIAPNYPELIQRCADATTPMVELASGIKNSGGKLAEWLGENTLDVFGETLVPFANGLRIFVNRVNSMAQEVPDYVELISNVTVAVAGLVRLSNALENMGGAGSFFTGDNTLKEFGDRLSMFGISFSDYSQSVSGVDAEHIRSLNPAIQELVDLAAQASTVTADAFTGLQQALVDLANVEVSSIATKVQEETPNIGTAFINMLDSLIGLIVVRTTADAPTYALYGNAIIAGIIAGINDEKLGYPILELRILEMIGAIIDIFREQMKEETFKEYGNNVSLGVKKGIEEHQQEVYDQAYECGKNVLLGLAEGLKDEAAMLQVTEAAETITEIINSTTQAGLGESSPSKIAYGFGRFYDMGLANGIADYAGLTVAATSQVSDNVINTANEIISGINSAIDSNMDSQPTIRPVLDTTDITKKAKNIGRMFDSSDLQLAYTASGSIKRMAEAKRNGNNVVTSSDSSGRAPTQINYTQNNYSPKALSRYEIYRQTRNQISSLKGALG